MRSRFEMLAETAGPRVLAYLARRCAQPADAADVMSEVFLVAWRRRDDLPGDDDAAVGWLFGVARGALANQRRGEARRTALAGRLREQLLTLTPAPGADSGVRDALARLKPEDREVLTLSVWEGLTAEQIAVAVESTPAAVRQRLVRARQRLREALGNRNSMAA